MFKLFVLFILSLPLLSFTNIQQNHSDEEYFTHIYEYNIWGGSGSGSQPRNSKNVAGLIQDFLKEKNIKSVVDAGCGDWMFGNQINWDEIEYMGFDVVQSIIEENIKKHKKPNINFYCQDFIKSELPEADLLICKHVLQHLFDSEIFEFIKQFNKYKYCLIINSVFSNFKENKSMESEIRQISWEQKGYKIGERFRPLDITKPPYNVPGKVLYCSSNGEFHVVLIEKENN